MLHVLTNSVKRQQSVIGDVQLKRQFAGHVVLQVVANAQVLHHRHAQRPQVLGRPDAGQHEQMCGPDDARAQDHFLPGRQPPAPVRAVHVLDAVHRPPVRGHQKPSHVTIGPDAQVAAGPQVWPQVRRGRRHPRLGAAHHELSDREAHRFRIAHVDLLVPQFLSGFYQRPRDRQNFSGFLHRNRAPIAVVFRLIVLVVLRHLEKWQHVIVSPPDVSVPQPTVVDIPMPSRVHRTLNRRRKQLRFTLK